ncbi:MAG: gamma-glutamyltransferase, partial [Pseudomonadota bacterium]
MPATIAALGAIACGHPITASAAVEMLQAGGNAFDAAIAAVCTATVVEPVLASLAGGGFLLARPAGGSAQILDFFVQTPRRRLGEASALKAVAADFGTTTQTFHIGAGAIATPGVVAGLFKAHRAFARLPLSELVAPAVAAARDGTEINAFQAGIFDIVRPIYEKTAPYRGVRTGTTLLQPELADTLEGLAREGPELFYQGEIAAALVGLCRDEGGHLNRADLAQYQVIERKPLRFNYRGFSLSTNPPPSAGGVLIRHTLRTLGDDPPTPTGLARALAATDKARMRVLASQGLVTRGTTHISVADSDGNLAAITLSNGEGAGRMIPGTGIMANNMLGEEDINPAGIDRWQPDERLGSMMAPTLATSRQQELILGSGGSNRIRSAIAQVIARRLNALAAGDSDTHNAEASVRAPRLHV